MLVSFISCSNQKEKSVSVLKGINLEGSWVMVNYFDSILVDKAIAKYSFYPLTWSAITFNIKHDSLFSGGILYNHQTLKIKTVNQENMTLNDNESTLFYYDLANDKIMAKDKSKGQYKNKVYTYRRVTEKRLLEILSPDDNEKLEKGLSRLFIEAFIVGKYKSLKDEKVLVLKPNNTMKGFKNFNSYFIDDNFGTMHPFRTKDAIFFKEQAFTSKTTDVFGTWYHWKISGDTMKLIEFKTNNGEDYFLDTTQYLFKRVSKL